MPGPWGAIDTGFPQFTGQESTDTKIATIQDYLYMLVENLGYTLRNLDIARNMNKNSVERFTGQITDPVYARIEGAEGKLTQLALTADGLGLRISNAEGDISTLTVTAQGLQSQVANANGQISSLSQTVHGFSLSVSNGPDFSYLTLSSNGINFGAATISFTGVVTFSDLSTAGRTTIVGNNITSGTITGVTLRSIGYDTRVEISGGRVAIFGSGSAWSWPVGGLLYDTNGQYPDAPYRMYLYTNPGYAMKIEAVGGNMSIGADGTVYAMGRWSFYGAEVVGLDI